MISTGEQISHYRIDKQIGGGGMGIIYKAEDLKLHRSIALKFLPPELTRDPESKKRFVHEARAASAIQHSNICTIHDIDETDDGQMFICMDYYDGDTLKKRIKNAPLPYDEVLDIAIQIADGLEYAHGSGIVHRDIKPANIIITTQGQVKIVDFGLVKLMGETTITDNNSTAGTVAYMSPEQARGGEVDQRTDIWALGVVLYEMLTGKHPFEANYDQAMIYNILNNTPEPTKKIRPELSAAVDLILEKCLQKDIAKRYQSITDLKNDLIRLKQNKRPSLTLRLPAITYSKKYHIFKYTAAILLIIVIIAGIYNWPFTSTVHNDRYLAVVPITNIGNTDANQIYCDALTEIVTSKLTELESVSGALFIIPAVDVRKYHVTSSIEAKQIFNAELAITGSLQRRENNLRLLLNLVETGSMRQIHSVDLNYNVSSLDMLEEEMMVSLLEMLEIHISPQVSQRIMPARIKNSNAYDYYLQGFGYLQRYERIENIETAIVQFNKALTYDSLYALAYAGLGEAYWRKYEADKNIEWTKLAVSNCQKALALDPDKIQVHATLGIVYNGTGDYNKALAEFDFALKSNPADANALRGKAAVFEGLGDLERAEKTYLTAIYIQPSYWAGYNNLGIFYYKQGLYTEAISQFDEVINLTPNNPKGYTNVGAMYFYQDKWEAAIKMYEKSLEIEPEYRAFSNLGALYYYKNEYRKAGDAFKKALEMDQHDYRLWGNLADCYQWQESGQAEAHLYYSKAIELAENQLHVNPNNASIISDLAGYYEGIGKFTHAQEMLNRALKLGSANLEDLFNITDAYEQMGNREQALVWMDKLLENGYSLAKIRSNPAFKELRQDAQYKHMLKKYSLE